MTSLRSYLLLYIFLVLVFLLRVQQVGGLRSNFNSTSENINVLESFGNYLSQKSDGILPQPQSSLLTGMLLGIKKNLPKDFSQALSNTSTTHIVVVSGENLSLVAGFVMFLAPYFGRKKTILLSTIVVILYCCLTGFQVSVIRAAIMVGFSFLAQILGKERTGFWVLFLTGTLMLIINPNWLFSISFQLSFLATFGVIAVAPELVQRLSRLPNLIRQDLAVSISAQILTLPIIAYNFHQVSLVGLLSNLFVLWTVSLIMITGALALTLSLISTSLGWLFALIPGVFLTYFVYMIFFFNSLPFSSISIGQTSIIFWLGYYVFLLGLFLQVKQSLRPSV